ncbi:hypothetical protein CQ054_22670 [Ochrobactrum sp. MYb29]|nr:hypothetical protein CQ054_22670 [Ochrobactrum sp. MYb29]
MTWKFIYPDVISDILAACSDHVDGSASADAVQRSIQRGEEAIVAIEENDIRRFLTDIEGQLELVKFTVDDDKQLSETQKIASGVIAWFDQRERRAGRVLPNCL